MLAFGRSQGLSRKNVLFSVPKTIFYLVLVLLEIIWRSLQYKCRYSNLSIYIEGMYMKTKWQQTSWSGNSIPCSSVSIPRLYIRYCCSRKGSKSHPYLIFMWVTLQLVIIVSHLLFLPTWTFDLLTMQCWGKTDSK